MNIDILIPLCAACGSLDCPGLAGVDFCPYWQEAEARNARGEYLTIRPYESADQPREI